MKEKVNKRMDKFIHILLKIARDKAFEWLIKLEKVSSKISHIRKRHKNSMNLSTDQIAEVGNSLWQVTNH